MEIHGITCGKRLEIKKTVEKVVETVDNFMHPVDVEKSVKKQFVWESGFFPQNSPTWQNAQNGANAL